MEGAFFRLEKQMEFPQAFQDLRNMVAIFSHAPGVDENVINVDELMEMLPENLMHEILEYGGGVD